MTEVGTTHEGSALTEEDAEILMVSCVPCTHRRDPEGRHPFAAGHRGFEEAGLDSPDRKGDE